GDLPVRDLPAVWNERYRQYLGVTPADDREGCLQDGHWAAGMFGYFPTYTLGNLFAAQLYEQARCDIGSLDGPFSPGHFADPLHWLRDRLHRHGGRYSPAQLLEQATGSLPAPGALVRYLRGKYGELYKV